MSTLTLGDLGRLPKATKPKKSVDYRAEANKVRALQTSLARDWATLPKTEKAELYGWASEVTEFRPSLSQLLLRFPLFLFDTWRMQRSGKYVHFVEYAYVMYDLVDQILCMQENDNPALNMDLKAAVYALDGIDAPVMRDRKETDDWLRSLL